MQENFSPQESLLLIQSMINKAKSDLEENRFYFLLWGWMAFLAFLAQFVLMVLVKFQYHYAVWLCTIPAIILTNLRSKKDERQRHTTYVGDSMRNLWLGLAFSFFVLSIIISFSPGGWYIAYPFFILFYGLGTFVSGMFLKFKPLIIGGIFNWVLACVCVLLPFQFQLLVAAAAILISYIIPGHLLKNPNRKGL
jgi:MFS family permease